MFFLAQLLLKFLTLKFRPFFSRFAQLSADRWGRDQRPGRVVRPNYNAPAVLFEHDDFGGAAYPVTAAIPHLNRVRFNDQVSSLLINSGRWEVCTDPNFRGRCEILDADVTSLGYYRLNDNITSIRPAGTGPGRPW